MSNRNSAALQSLSVSLGIPLAFNSENTCELVLDDETVVTLEGEPEGTSLRINGLVGDLAEPDSAEALRLLLQANYNGQGTGGAALGIDPVGGDVVLGRVVDVSGFGPDDLETVLTEFANYLAFWRDNLNRLTAGEAAGPAGSAPDAFVRV